MAFLPYDPTRKRSLTGPADDWHAQWGAPPEASGPGGGSVPFSDPKVPASWQPTQDIYGNPLGPAGSAPGHWNVGAGSGPQTPAQPAPQQGGGGFTPLSQLARGGAMGIRAPQKSAEDVRLLQDPAFKQQYGQWVMAQGPGAADWATPTIFQQQRQQPGAPGGTGPAGQGGGALVLLRAPNGQTKQVPGDQVAHYLARGATRG